ncbi:MAG: hypothetical protein RL621_1166 [Bacteroidota bacterium]|jgi:hypothetical protein
MRIEIGDIIFYVYELLIVCGLIFRFYLSFVGTVPPIKDEVILPLPDTPELIVAEPIVPEIIEETSNLFIVPVTKKEYLLLFRKVLEWCQSNIRLGSNRKIKPFIQVSFSKRGDVLGFYQYTNKLIMIYVLKHDTLLDAIQTFIHEYVHHLQIRSTKDNIRYNSITKRKGYYSNDFEIEARQLSNYYLKDCCKELNIHID